MKKKILNMFLAGAAIALMIPAGAIAATRGGGHGFSSPRGFSGNVGRPIAPVGHAYYPPYRGGVHYYGGGGAYLGFGAPYAYGYAAPAPPAPCGFYDQAGYWHPDPACYPAGAVGY